MATWGAVEAPRNSGQLRPSRRIGVREREINLFNCTTPESLPLLECLKISCVIHERRYFDNEILKLLRLAPNIVECVLARSPLHVSVPERPVTLSLRRLTFGDWHQWNDCDDCDTILNRLSLPALEMLSLPMHSISGSDLLRFMERLRPPLQELVMGRGYRAMLWTDLHEYLHLIPSLARFEMWRLNAQIVADLSAALLDFPSLLPNLRSLTIHTGSGIRSSESSWRMLVRAVSTRRIQFHLVGQLSQALPADVLAAFEELVGDGVEIHIDE
ncbi:hypothetical protein B0H12DRAFT_851599 [Mycena haematopus]|nr:hypothetical protein B0H12DRAFT_851599 [Mycena haematopus]